MIAHEIVAKYRSERKLIGKYLIANLSTQIALTDMIVIGNQSARIP